MMHIYAKCKSDYLEQDRFMLTSRYYSNHIASGLLLLENLLTNQNPELKLWESRQVSRYDSIPLFSKRDTTRR